MAEVRQHRPLKQSVPECPGGCVRTRALLYFGFDVDGGPTPRVSYSAGLGWDLRTSISNELPG